MGTFIRSYPERHEQPGQPRALDAMREVEAGLREDWIAEDEPSPIQPVEVAQLLNVRLKSDDARMAAALRSDGVNTGRLYVNLWRPDPHPWGSRGAEGVRAREAPNAQRDLVGGVPGHPVLRAGEDLEP